MKYTITESTNYCRVFALPKYYPKEYFEGCEQCVSRVIPTPFFMVDEFPLIPRQVLSTYSEEKPFTITVERLEKDLLPELLDKPYVRTGVKYLVLTEFGPVFTFTKGSDSHDL